MIVHISAPGDRPRGLVEYLAGPGKANEHTNPRTIAGSAHYPGPMGADVVKQVSADLQMHQKMWPDVKVPKGHVWHASLSLRADEGVIPDSKWAAIAQDYMREMGFDTPGKSPVQWVAVHHGQSVEGNDHIHIVASRIREDGTKWSNWNDMPRSQRIALKLEQKYGLNVLQSRAAKLGAGSVPYTQAEVAKARAAGTPIARVEIERQVRAAVAASGDEAEFVRRLRSNGFVVRPWPDKGAVTGWKIGVAADGEEILFSGSKIARDLTLPKLREKLPNGGGNRAEAEAEWRAGGAGVPVLVGGPETKTVAVAPDLVTKVQGDLVVLGRQLQNATPEQFAELSGDVAGVLAAASVAVEGDKPGQLARASREVGAWAQPTKVGSRKRASRVTSPGRGMALMMLQAADPQGVVGQSIMMRQLMEAVQALHRLHRTSREAAGGFGRSTMTSPDGLDEAFGSATTITITGTAIGTSAWADRRRQRKLEGGGRRSVLSFKRPTEFGEKDPLPKGLQGMISQDEWRGMDDAQRKMVDPDRVGRWPTDYSEGSPGATLQATKDQEERIRVLSATSGEPVPLVSDMPRGRAAEHLRRLEDRLGPEVTGAAYLKAGLVNRKVVEEKGKKRFELEFPGAQGATVVATSPDPTPVSSRPPTMSKPTVTMSNQSKAPSDPLQWKSAKEPVSKAQSYTLREYGFSAEDIGKLRKGGASVVISAIDKHGHTDPQKVDEAYDRVLAAMIQTPPVASQNPQTPPQAPSVGGQSR